MQFASRPGIRQPRNTDACGSSAPACRSLGNDGESNASPDHAADGIEAANAHPQLQRLAGLNSSFTEMLLEGVCSREADELLVEQ